MGGGDLVAFKNDESFLEKIAMGAIGTQRVFQDLRTQGHQPIELERGSTSYKIWKKVKIKRIRVPDILCVGCGRRIESRTKTELSISMSHSTANVERGWDFGLNDEDMVAFPVCARTGERPIDWVAAPLVQYVSVASLRAAKNAGQTLAVAPKGAEEGFEQRLVWPSAVANFPGVVDEITNERIKYLRQPDGRTISMSRIQQGIVLDPLVRPGDTVTAGQVLASVVPVTTNFPCDRVANVRTYLRGLGSVSLSERYAAAKALSHFPPGRGSVEGLLRRIGDRAEHIYVKLESAATLARYGHEDGWAVIERCLGAGQAEPRLEAVIVLAEINSDRSLRLLQGVLTDRTQLPEIRAGAAWGLGELNSVHALEALVNSFMAQDEVIRVEAARSLARLARSHETSVLESFARATPETRPGIAWALGKASSNIEQLIPALTNVDARHWISYVVGTQDPRRYVEEIELLRGQDPEVYFAVTVLWKILNSWVFDLEEYG